MRELELQEFVDEIYADFKNNEDTEYIFFLGAGCSKSSGIPLASELAKAWYEELKKQIIKFDKFNKKHKISNSQGLDYGKFYFQIFEELFPTPLMQQKEIQRITNDDKVNPSLGYYVLASLMQLSSFNTIVTTNFDNLIQDALIYSGNKRALVITHQDLAKFIKRDNTPLITKIHGDAHLHPFNNISSTKTIPDELKGAIQGLFTNAKVICIGYGGNDESIADFLNGCNRIDQVYWLNFSEPKDVKLSNWWDKLSTKTYINEYDFDKIMSIIKSKFDIKSPNFERRAKVLQDRYESAIQEEIEDIEQMKDKTYLDYFILGNTYDNQKEYIKAIQAYQKAIKLNPKYSDAYYNLGIMYVNEGQYDKAIEVYQKAIELNPKNDMAYNNMGIAYESNNEHIKAIQSYQKAIKLNPKYSDAYYNLGIVYGKEDEYDKAIEVYQRAIELNPKNDKAYNNIGVIYKNKEEYDKAIEAHQKAIELNPKNDKAIINIGNIYYIKEECDKAIEVYQKVIELNPKNDAAYINLFEIQIIQDKPLSDELEKKCILFFEKNKNVFIQYEMLKILSLINQNKEVELDKWLDEYKEQNLGNWRFDELVRWANRKEGEIKEKLLEAIEIFKTKLS